jgi:Flp pilus assembly secretin CpaC
MPTGTTAILRRAQRAVLGLLPLLLLAGSGLCPVRAESTPVVLIVGDSRAFGFDRMKQVATTDPNIADVMVTGWNEMLIVGKNPGKTKVYVWDRCGRHDYAVVIKPALTPMQLQRQLEEVAPPQWNFTYKILDYKTLYVHSQVMSDEEKAAVEKLLQGLPDKEQVNLVYLIEYASPAARQAVVLRKLVPDRYGIVIWDQATLMIVGQAGDQSEIEKLDQLAKSGSTGGVQVINLASLSTSAESAPVAEIAAALGRPYQVWLLQGRTVVVEGIAPDQAAKDRVDKLLAVFAKQADIINLVRVAETPGLPIGQVRDLLQEALGNSLQARVIGGRVIVLEGGVPDETTLRHVEQVVKAVAHEVPVTNLVRVVAPATRQVLVHCRVLDVRKSALDKMGVAWGEAGGVDQTPNVWHIGFAHGEPFTSNLEARLDLLVTQNDARELATPNLLVNDGEEASILVGGEIPIPVPQTGEGGMTITIEYKQFGVLLKVKPVVLDDQRVRLMVAPEVSDIDRTKSVTIAGFNLPGFVTRRESTTTDMLSGDTLAIGGLLQTTTSTVINKIPILGDIPILGALFRSKEYIEGKTELVILVTPEILDTTARMHTTAAGGAEATPGTEGH